LLSAPQLVILFPLIFFDAQRHLSLYVVPPDAGWREWVYLSIDSYNKALLSVFDQYLHFLFFTLNYAASAMRCCAS